MITASDSHFITKADPPGNVRTKPGVGAYQYGSQCSAVNRMHAAFSGRMIGHPPVFN